jgi:hypothetical protein
MLAAQKWPLGISLLARPVRLTIAPALYSGFPLINQHLPLAESFMLGRA